MAQPKQPKGGRKDDGGNQHELTAGETARLAEQSPLTGLTSAFAQLDQRDAGEAADHSEDQAEEGEYFDDGENDEVSQPEAPEQPDEAAEVRVASEGTEERSAVEDVLGGGFASGQVLGDDATSRREHTVSKIKAVAEETISRAEKLRDHGALKIGDIIIDDEFNGNIEDLLSKNPRKRQSLNKISQDIGEHQNLKMDPRWLGRCCRGSALRRRFKAKGVDVSGFSLADFEALLLEHDPEEQLALAWRIIREGLSARKIKDLIQDAKRKDYPEDIGKTLHTNIARLIEMVQDPDLVKTGSDKDILHKDLSRRDRKILRDQIRSGKPEFAKLMKFLSDLEENLTSIDGEDRSQVDEDSTSQDRDEEE